MSKDISKNDIDKIHEILSGVSSQFGGQQLSDLISENNTKLIECKHEIVISVSAQIYEENDTGETISSKEISQKNYHIPVPSNKNYEEYLKGFLNFLENCMLKSIEYNEKDNTNE